MPGTPTTTHPMLATVTVTYNPDISQLRTQLLTLPESSQKVIVDNASSNSTEIVQLQDRFSNLIVECNEDNLGLAAGLNQGLSKIRELSTENQLVLLLDQDSEPEPGSIQSLVDSYTDLETKGLNPGAVGPQMKDVKTGLTHGFHRSDWWHWYRVYPDVTETAPVQCDSVNGSGMLMRLTVHEQLGGFDESFFIDHLDTDWSFRLLASNYTLWGVPNAVFRHRMGEDTLKFWFLGWRIWPYRSPLRHYYLFRNTIALIKARHPYKVWKFWAVLKLILTLTVHLLADSQRWKQLREMWRGIKEGLRYN